MTLNTILLSVYEAEKQRSSGNKSLLNTTRFLPIWSENKTHRLGAPAVEVYSMCFCCESSLTLPKQCRRFFCTQSWHCGGEVRGQKIEGKKGVKPAAATSQGGSVSRATARNPVLWQQRCPCQPGPRVKRRPVLPGDTEHPCCVRNKSGREQSRTLHLKHLHPSVLQLYLFLPCRFFFTLRGWNMLYKHSVSVCKKHAFLTGVCTSRLFALAMWS